MQTSSSLKQKTRAGRSVCIIDAEVRSPESRELLGSFIVVICDAFLLLPKEGALIELYMLLTTFFLL